MTALFLLNASEEAASFVESQPRIRELLEMAHRPKCARSSTAVSLHSRSLSYQVVESASRGVGSNARTVHCDLRDRAPIVAYVSVDEVSEKRRLTQQGGNNPPTRQLFPPEGPQAQTESTSKCTMIKGSYGQRSLEH